MIYGDYSLILNDNSLIPVMGVCYMMQYMDKLALSQATLFNIREDLVRCTTHERRNALYRLTALLSSFRVSTDKSIPGLPLSFTSDISYGAPSAPT